MHEIKKNDISLSVHGAIRHIDAVFLHRPSALYSLDGDDEHGRQDGAPLYWFQQFQKTGFGSEPMANHQDYVDLRIPLSSHDSRFSV